MDSPATPSIPRLRLSRNPHALERFLSSSPRDHLPEPAGVLADEDLDDNDRDDDQESTPKMSSTVLLDTSKNPAARLRALLALSPASSKSTPMPLPSSRSSDIDSDFEPLDASYGSTRSAARESLKDIFSRAMRDPGNTPQKTTPKLRRNSIDTSEVDASPRVELQRKENKGKRQSLSDEEADPAKTSETSFRSSQATTFDILRERLINSHSQLQDLRFPDLISHGNTYTDSIPDDDNDAIPFSNINITTTTPPVATSTPHQSLHMFIDSHLPSQSNLLDRDSEMRRAFEGFESSDTEGASQRPVSFPPSITTAHQTQKPPRSQPTRTLKSLLSRDTYITDSSQASASIAKGQHATPQSGISRSILVGDHKANELNLEEDLGSSRTPVQPLKLKTNGTTLSRSPSPSTAKGQAKALDQSPFLDVNTTSFNSSHPERTSFSAIKSGPSPRSSFSFVKRRIPLEPIELETGKFGQKARKDVLSLSTKLKASAKPDSVSSQKSDLPDRASIRSSSPVPNFKFVSFQSESSSVSDTNTKSRFLDVSSVVDEDQDGDEPDETPEYVQPRSSSPLQLSNDIPEPSGTNLQQRLDFSLSEPVTQKPQKLQEYSPLPSPPRVKPISPLLTPPRRPSTSQVDFKTPSPPRHIPDLPGPPTSSEDEVEEESTRPPFGYLRSDLTAMKTPRPPGAWTYTPAVLRKTSRLSLPENSIKHEERDSNLQPADLDSKPDINTAEVPKPSGSRVSTPIPFSSQKQNLPHSGNPEVEHENGLSTPAASFSKRSLSYAKTPALPGAYFVTPAARKSVNRVRFDGLGNSDSKDSTTRDSLEDITNASSLYVTPRTTLPQVNTPSRTRTRDLSTPISPGSRRTKSQTPTNVRVLDAFGRELVKDEAGKAENNELKNGIRVVDALGHQVDDDQPSHSTTSITKANVSELSTPLEHGEALLRVRQGLSDLVNDLDEMDKLEQNCPQSDFTRLEKLQQTSAEARVARVQVSAAISSNAEDIERKLRANMKESKLPIYSTGGRRWQVSWIICFVLIIQLSLVTAMYRISATRARELFLTTYYDPFYPDLHLYITKPDASQFSMHSLTRTSWFSLPHTFYFEGWKASALQIWHNLSIMSRNWQQLLWEKVGEGSPQITSWPPT